jgi:hypothetical protein
MTNITRKNISRFILISRLIPTQFHLILTKGLLFIFCYQIGIFFKISSHDILHFLTLTFTLKYNLIGKINSNIFYYTKAFILKQIGI